MSKTTVLIANPLHCKKKPKRVGKLQPSTPCQLEISTTTTETTAVQGSHNNNNNLNYPTTTTQSSTVAGTWIHIQIDNNPWVKDHFIFKILILHLFMCKVCHRETYFAIFEVFIGLFHLKYSRKLYSMNKCLHNNCEQL